MTTLVITQCTGEKTLDHPDRYTKADFLTGKVKELPSTTAREMYAGQQHKRLLRGLVGRTDVELYVVSAGYGMVHGDLEVWPYDITFSGMSKGELTSWSRTLCLPQAFRHLMSQRWDFVLVLLGKPYLQALGITRSVIYQSSTMFLCSEDSAKLVPRFSDHPQVVTLSREHCAAFHCGNIGLKGEVGARLLRRKDLDPTGKPHLFWDPDILARLALDTPSGEA